MGFFRITYKIVLTRNTDAGIVAVKMKTINPKAAFYRYKQRKYPIDLSQCAYMRRLTRFLFVDMDSGVVYNFIKNPSLLLPADWDNLNYTDLVKTALLSAVGGNIGLVVTIAVGVACLLGGIMVGKFFLGDLGRSP